MKNDNRRSHPRTTTFMPFQVCRMTPEEKDSLECRISTGSIVIEESTPPPVEDERLNQWLNMLNAKLDYLLSAPLKQKGIVSMSFEPLNISGSGMSLITEEAFIRGEILEIKIVLQSYPAKILNLYGKVVRVTPTAGKPERFTTAVQFMNICDAVRDEILNFDFRKHGEKMFIKKKTRKNTSRQSS